MAPSLRGLLNFCPQYCWEIVPTYLLGTGSDPLPLLAVVFGGRPDMRVPRRDLRRGTVGAQPSQVKQKCHLEMAQVGILTLPLANPYSAIWIGYFIFLSLVVTSYPNTVG